MIQLQIIYITYRGVSVLSKYPPSQNHNKAVETCGRETYKICDQLHRK